MSVRARGIVVAAAALAVTAVGGTALAVHGGAGHLDVCCSWNEAALGGGALTYKVSGGNEMARSAVRSAIEDWDGADVISGGVTGLSLNEVFGKTAANITVSFKKGGGQTQGVALRSFDREGFVRSVKVTISGQAFGLSNDSETIKQITRHEMGHALGLGHSDFPDLMFPTLGEEKLISDCDIEGVEVANAWAFDGNPATGSVQPSLTQIPCS